MTAFNPHHEGILKSLKAGRGGLPLMAMFFFYKHQNTSQLTLGTQEPTPIGYCRTLSDEWVAWWIYNHLIFQVS